MNQFFNYSIIGNSIFYLLNSFDILELKFKIGEVKVSVAIKSFEKKFEGDIKVLLSYFNFLISS